MFVFFALIGAVIVSATEVKNVPILNFRDPVTAQELKWEVVSDKIRGGKSEGNIAFDATQKITTFAGKLELLDGAGFVLARALKQLDLRSFESLSVIVVGDGRKYRVLLTDATLDSLDITYQYTFSTQAGTLQRVEFNLSDMEAMRRGKKVLDAPPLDLEKARIAFQLNDKNPGPFVIDLIQVSGNPAQNSITTGEYPVAVLSEMVERSRSISDHCTFNVLKRSDTDVTLQISKKGVSTEATFSKSKNSVNEKWFIQEGKYPGRNKTGSYWRTWNQTSSENVVKILDANFTDEDQDFVVSRLSLTELKKIDGKLVVTGKITCP